MMINEIFRIEGRNPENPSEKSKYSLEEIANIRKNKTQKLAEKIFRMVQKNPRDRSAQKSYGQGDRICAGTGKITYECIS